MNKNKKTSGAQFVYFSHGGGPLPLLNNPSHHLMKRFMEELPSLIRKPEAIIVISAHWEEEVATVQTGSNPPMLYDYYGFPKESYEIQYPAKGNPVLAEKVIGLLQANGISCKADAQRGYDHGLFIPLKIMFPKADIPTFQISLLNNLDAKEHIMLGNALSSLKDENILIIGSGFSFHNLAEFSFLKKDQDTRNNAFQSWLIEVCTKEMSQMERERKLIKWSSAPNARYCHPRSEHLLPLHVCVGAAKKKAELVFHNHIAGKRAVAFLWR